MERNLELSNSSYQRQLVAEKKKTISAQEEIRTLQEELERLTNKLKVQHPNKPDLTPGKTIITEHKDPFSSMKCHYFFYL